MPMLSLFLLALAAPAAAPATIPPRFRGEWARTPADCSVNKGDNTVGFTVTAKTIGYYEESEAIRTVRVTGANSIAYTAILSSPEGDEPSTGELRLSPDGKQMLSGSETLIHCPK